MVSSITFCLGIHVVTHLFQGITLSLSCLQSLLLWYPWDPIYWDMMQHKEYAGTRVSGESCSFTYCLLMHLWGE